MKIPARWPVLAADRPIEQPALDREQVTPAQRAAWRSLWDFLLADPPDDDPEHDDEAADTAA
jgi:hypothetical protein